MSRGNVEARGTWEWDGSWIGVRSRTKDPDGEALYFYDQAPFGVPQPTRVERTWNQRTTDTEDDRYSAFEYGYTLDGRVLSTTWPGGTIVEAGGARVMRWGAVVCRVSPVETRRCSVGGGDDSGEGRSSPERPGEPPRAASPHRVARAVPSPEEGRSARGTSEHPKEPGSEPHAPHHGAYA